MKTTAIPNQWKAGTFPVTRTDYQLDMRGRVTSSSHSVGEMTTQVHTQYDGAGRVVSQTDVAGLVTSYAYSDGGLTTTVTVPTGATFVSKRHTDGSLLEESGSGQAARYYSYLIHTLGIMTRVRLDAPDNGTIVSETVSDALGRTRIARVPGGDGTMLETRHGYDARGRLFKTERDGRPDLLYEYDDMGHLVRQIEKTGQGEIIDPSLDRVVTYSSGRTNGDKMNSPLLEILFETVTGHMDESEKTAFRSRFVFRKAGKTYHQYGGGAEHVSETSFELVSDAEEDLTNIALTIDKYGREQLAYTLKEGNVEIDCVHTGTWENMAWKARVGSLLLSEGDKGCAPTYYRYDRTSSAQTQVVTDSRGNTTTITHDKAGRVVRVTDATGIDIETNWYGQSTGLLTKTTNALGENILYSYDERGRKRSEYGSATYPACYQYDNFDRLVRLETFRTDDMLPDTNPWGRADGDATVWTYDRATGQVLEKTYADGLSDTYLYDHLGRMIEKRLASGRTIACEYQPGIDDPVSVQYASEGEPTGILTERTYDHWGRVAAVDHHDENRQAYSYKTGLTYNSRGDLEEEIFFHEYMNAGSGVMYSIIYGNNYRRDAQGRQNGYAVNVSGGSLLSVNVEHDSMDRIVAVTQNGAQRFEFGYNAVTGAKERLTYPNGVVKTLNFEEQRDYLSGIDYKKPGASSSMFTQHISYDPEGRLIGETRRLEGGDADARNYTYNAKGELTGFTTVAGSGQAWSYDPAGNRKAAYSGDTHTTYASNGLNQYQSVMNSLGSSYNPTYDPDGNQLAVKTGTGIWQVVYGPDGRSESYSSGSMKYGQTHDDRSRLMMKLDVNDHYQQRKAQLSYYIGELPVFQGDYDLTLGDIVIKQSYLWDPTENTAYRPLALNRYGALTTFGCGTIDLDAVETSYYLHDHNKNVIALMNDQGALQSSYEYDPYGNITSQSGELASLNPFRFSSERHDDQTGLVNYLYRSYNPLEGRWTQRDPIAEQGGINLYNFVSNKPSFLIDRFGLIAIMDCKRVTYSDDGEWGYICNIYEIDICKEIKCCERESKQLNMEKNYKTLISALENLNKCLSNKCSGRTVKLTVHGPIYANFAVDSKDNSKSKTVGDPYGRSGPLPPGAFRILPRPTGGNVDVPGNQGVSFHKGTPSPTSLNQTTPGHVISPTGVLRTGLRIHGPFKSLGCLTCASGTSSNTGEGLVEQIMNKNNKCGGMYLEITDSNGIPAEHYDNLVHYMQGQHPDEGYYSPFPIKSQAMEFTL